MSILDDSIREQTFKSFHRSQRLDEKLQNETFHPKVNCLRPFFLSSRNVCQYWMIVFGNKHSNHFTILKDWMKIYKMKHFIQ